MCLCNPGIASTPARRRAVAATAYRRLLRHPPRRRGDACVFLVIAKPVFYFSRIHPRRSRTPSAVRTAFPRPLRGRLRRGRARAAGSPSFKRAPPRRAGCEPAAGEGGHSATEDLCKLHKGSRAPGAAMRPKLLWTDPGLPPRREDDVKATVYSMAFNPSGTELVVAVANLVLVYATDDGDLRHRLRGHKDLVYTVSYGREGSKFASGGADNTVIIWNSRGEGVLKYTHSDSIQVVAHNPCCDQLASCTEGDFGLWSSTAKSVTKHKVGSKILSAKWSNDGQYLALGMYDLGVLHCHESSPGMRDAGGSFFEFELFRTVSGPSRRVRDSGRIDGVFTRQRRRDAIDAMPTRAYASRE